MKAFNVRYHFQTNPPHSLSSFSPFTFYQKNLESSNFIFRHNKMTLHLKNDKILIRF